MHFNKRASNESLLTASSTSSSSEAVSPSALRLSSLSSTSKTTTSSSAAATSPSSHAGVRLGLWCFLLLAVVLMAQQQPCEGRYLPTRSRGDDLDKLRELMLQILESSNEDQRPPNEANGNTMSAQRANWLNKLSGGGGGPLDGLDARKYAPHGVYDNGRYY
ncbi:uncharacterized protein LOC133324159 [Musca vetustissima]|uniref:uncharacterized protein LOC133324159 n=1 Tax=Musca vetustissima TaxID=27455 RepID=UPI002AB6766D|nr:uncharacterized protein LOC133324159 [Musca vetustissima]